MRYALSLLRPIVGQSVSREMPAYFCPNDGATCWVVKGDDGYYPVLELDWLSINCRKPGHGMLRYAIDHYRPMFADLNNVVFVGDCPEDEQAAINAGIKFIWSHDWLVS